MTQWFFRFLKISSLLFGFCLALGLAILMLVKPNERDIALIPMSVHSSSMQAAGFLVNSTRTPWIIYVAGTNESTTTVRLTRLVVTTEELQAVRYDTPAMSPTDRATFRIVYARNLGKANNQ